MTLNYQDIHKEVIELCKTGNPKAQYQLYQLYSKAMFSICMRMMKTREEAEDMLQESFTEAFTRLETFRFESSFGAWLKRIVVNKCINGLKKKKVELEYADEIKTDDTAEEAEEDIESEYLNVKRIQHAMEYLPDGYRVIFSLYLMEGYDHTEIAQILNISESTSKSQYLRAKRKLKGLLKQLYYER